VSPTPGPFPRLVEDVDIYRRTPPVADTYALALGNFGRWILDSVTADRWPAVNRAKYLRRRAPDFGPERRFVVRYLEAEDGWHVLAALLGRPDVLEGES
jgi:hypothetical protein